MSLLRAALAALIAALLGVGFLVAGLWFGSLPGMEGQSAPGVLCWAGGTLLGTAVLWTLYVLATFANLPLPTWPWLASLAAGRITPWRFPDKEGKTDNEQGRPP